ncbi:centriolar satellite-associated tubulin polyglutamylase complex regulator 1 isoform X3 [Lepidochelys kempii]|uniref:centriolar satellite-associated tubulin polyglutamylase complex regulator 1 isoform X3 n=1 Tax=Lepidochelys kempii TaxID=8472 RepID=UPI003C703B72
MALPDSSLNILTVCVKELTFCSESSASSKPHPTTGHPSYGPSGDASEQWVKMEITEILHTQHFPSVKICLQRRSTTVCCSCSALTSQWNLLRRQQEFLESVAAIYQDLLTGKNPNTVIVPTSSSGQHRSRQAPSECSPLDGVEASLFYHCLESLCDRSKYSCPPSALVKEVLSSVQRLTFYGFLMALAKHHGINRALGALPDKGDLLLDPPMDKELENLLSQVSGLSISTPAGSSGDIANLPTRTSPRISSPWKPLHHRQKVDTESDGSTDETESSEN